jgi:hypothetical protein
MHTALWRRPRGSAPQRPPASPAGGHASPHLCTRPQRAAAAPAGAPRRTAERGPERPGQAAQDGGAGSVAELGSHDVHDCWPTRRRMIEGGKVTETL